MIKWPIFKPVMARARIATARIKIAFKATSKPILCAARLSAALLLIIEAHQKGADTIGQAGPGWNNARLIARLQSFCLAQY